MVSRLAWSLVARIGLVFIAGVAAHAAWRAEYWASLAVCLLLTLWALLDLIVESRQRADGAEQSQRPLMAAVLAREREARTLAAFLDHAPVPLLSADRDGRLSALNMAARQFFGTDDIVVQPDPALGQAVAGASPGERQTLTLPVDGAARAFALTTADLMSDGDAVRVVALVDIQAEIQAAEAAALRELIQVLSHEIMNSLTPVTSLAQTAADLLADAPGQPQALDLAREAAQGVADRSRGLLRFIEAYRVLARLPEPRVAEVSVSALTADVALLFRSRWEDQGVRLDVASPPDVTAPLDRDLFVQALLNVLANAAEAALQTGQPPRVRLNVQRSRQHRMILTVEDSGPGVQLADPSVIFRPFFTTKAEGTGVGLSLARQVVLAHGGAISVGVSELGGAEIRILL